jgi:RecA/RadA recombinase
MSDPKFLSKMNKIFKGAVTAESILQYDGPVSVSTSSMMLDWALGRGFVIGKVNSIAGLSGSFKSGFAIMAAAKLQQSMPGSFVIIKDTEMFYDFNPVAMQRLRSMGLDLSRTLIQSTNDAAEILGNFETEKQAIKSGEVVIAAYIVDSLNGVTDPYESKKIAEGDAEAMSNGKVGGSASKMNKAFMKAFLSFAACATESNRVTFFVIQHVYQELDQYKKLSDPLIVSGGESVRYFVRSRIILEAIKKKGSTIGFDGKTSDKSESMGSIAKTIRCRVTKSGFCLDGRKVDFFFDFVNLKEVRQGEALRDLAINLKVIKKINNVTFEYNGIKFRGKDDVALQIDKDEKLKQSIYQACLDSSMDMSDFEIEKEEKEEDLLT